MRDKFIAIVEDDIDDQDFVCNAIEKLQPGILLKVFNNGLEFFHYLQDNPHLPDVVITDLRMPLMTGWELITDLKLNKNTHHIPIAILSTSSSKEDTKRAMELGACVYHVKPHSPGGYKLVVESIIQQCSKSK